MALRLARADELRAALRDVLAETGVPWACYGEHSGFYLHLDPLAFDPATLALEAVKRASQQPLAATLRLALAVEGTARDRPTREVPAPRLVRRPFSK